MEIVARYCRKAWLDRKMDDLSIVLVSGEWTVALRRLSRVKKIRSWRFCMFLTASGPKLASVRRSMILRNFIILKSGWIFDRIPCKDRRLFAYRPELAVTEADLESKDIPSSYVPFRNANMLSIATSWAEVMGATAIYIGRSPKIRAAIRIAGLSFMRLFRRRSIRVRSRIRISRSARRSSI